MSNSGAGEVVPCGQPVPPEGRGMAHIFDASTKEVISHKNSKDGDHVKVTKEKRKRPY